MTWTSDPHTPIKDDCYIPGFMNADPEDLSQTSVVTASSHIGGCEPENVINGISRSLAGAQNCWESDGLSGAGEEIVLKLPSPKLLKQLRITFDPDLSRGIQPCAYNFTEDSQPKGMPPVLVKSYAIKVHNGNSLVYSKEVAENHQRLNIHEFPEGIRADRVSVTVLGTYGHRNARIFEIRLY